MSVGDDGYSLHLKPLGMSFIQTNSNELSQEGRQSIFGQFSFNICSDKVPNKAFKSDSQRLAFFIPSLGFVFTVI
ncbi:hypothetical protein BJL75_22820 [Vibrio parahaemolyticus]|nr:hypothetical protein BJL75_22820 [Vibrio parahaemolyticus]